MPKNCQRTSDRGSWSKSDMRQAVESVMKGERLSVAARMHNVPRTTLRRQLLGPETSGGKKVNDGSAMLEQLLKTRHRPSWLESDMILAIDAVKKGGRLATMAHMHGVPRSTLRRRIESLEEENCRLNDTETGISSSEESISSHHKLALRSRKVPDQSILQKARLEITNRPSWSELDMQTAIDAVKKGVRLTTAAKMYCVSRSTLRGRVLGAKSRGPNRLYDMEADASSLDGNTDPCYTLQANSIQNEHSGQKYPAEHPRNVLTELCRKMLEMGWMAGAGGSVSIKEDQQVFITPMGVAKEDILPQDIFVLDEGGELLECPAQEKGLNVEDSSEVFLSIYSKKNVGAIIHSHSAKAVMVTLICKGREFQISHQEMVKGMFKGNSGERYSNTDTLIIPIIENRPTERELKDRVMLAMERYPMSNAVLIRRHGLFVWGSSWQRARSQAECLDYLFDLALQMYRHGMDPAAEPANEDVIID